MAASRRAADDVSTPTVDDTIVDDELIDDLDINAAAETEEA